MATVPYRFHNQSGYVPASELDSDFDFLSSGGGIGGITIGTSPITGGTTTRVLYDNAGIVGEYVITGTGNVVMSDGPVFSGSLAATGSGFLGDFNTTVTTGDGTGDIGGLSFLYTATGADNTVQLRNTAYQMFVNSQPGSTGAIAVDLDAFISLGPTGGQDTGNLTAAVVHRAHYSNKSTNVSPQEITTAYTFWAAGVDVNDVGATGTVKTNVAFNITDQSDTSRSAYSTGKVTRDTHGIRINDFTEGAISNFGITGLMTAASIATSTDVRGNDSPSFTITIAGTITGIFYPRMTLTGGVTTGVTIASQSSVTTVTATSSVASITGKVLTIGGTVTGTWAANQLVIGAGVTANTVIFAQLPGGTPGGAGTYSLSQASSVGPISVTGGTAGGAGTYVLSNAVTISSTIPISISAATIKQNLNLTGTAPNIITGPVRFGDTTLPQTATIDAHYSPGTFPAGGITANQFITIYSEVNSGNTSQPLNVLDRVISAGTHNMPVITAAEHEVDIGNTAGTITTAYASRGFIQTTNATGVGITTTTAAVQSALFKAGGIGTIGSVNLFNAETLSLSSGSDTITTARGLRINDIGHATRVGTAIGVDIADITASATLTAGILSAMNTGTNKYFIRHTGTAVSSFGGRIVSAASVASAAGFNIPNGTAPTSPVDGDMWTTTAGLFVRINGSTVGPLS